MSRLIGFFVMMAAALPATAALNVMACEPEWAALLKELAGEQAQVVSATTARQDPHRIEARPALLARARNADLLVCTGAELEVGWLPLLQRDSGNARIRPGQPGFFEAAAFVPLLEKPAVVDRSMGDVHAAGNPHIHLDPRNLLKLAAPLSQRLAALDPANESYYATRQRDFVARMQAAIARWEKQAESLVGVRIVVHHKNWSYLAAWLGLDVAADLEPKPGIEPSAFYLTKLLDKLETEPARMVLRAPYQSPKASQWIAAKLAIPAVELPFTIGGSDAAKDLFSLFDDTLARLTKAAGDPGRGA